MKYKEYYDHILNEAFGDVQKKKWLDENPTLDSSQIDIYINWFDELRKTKPATAKNITIDGVPNGNDRFDISKYKDWHTFESFVDAVRAEIPMGSGIKTTQLEIDGKPLFEKNGLEVYYADTPRACIKYKGNVPYSWCISRPDSSNMFYAYRLRENQPAFYFVKDVEATKQELDIKKTFSGKFENPYHFFVLQVLKNAKNNNTSEKSYVVTSANNDGDKHMSWNEIVAIQPKLNGLQNEFLPKPLSAEEREKVEKYKRGISDQEFANLPYEEKEMFLDIYPSIGKPISDKIFQMMPLALKNKYIGFGIGLKDKQYEIVKNDKNLLKRYIQITERKFAEWLKIPHRFDLTQSEIDVLIDNKILNEYIDQLKDNHISYLLRHSTDTQKIIDFLLSKGLSVDKILTDDNVGDLLNFSKDKQKTIDILFSKNVPLTDDNVSNLLYFSVDTQKTIDILLSKGLSIDKILTDHNVHHLLSFSKDKQKTINILLSKNVPLTDRNVSIFLYYSVDTQIIDILFSKNIPLTDQNVDNLLHSSVDKQKTIDILFSKNVPLTDDNVYNLLRCSPNLIDTQRKINMLKAKQQLGESKFKYTDYYKHLIESHVSEDIDKQYAKLGTAQRGKSEILLERSEFNGEFWIQDNYVQSADSNIDMGHEEIVIQSAASQVISDIGINDDEPYLPDMEDEIYEALQDDLPEEIQTQYADGEISAKDCLKYYGKHVLRNAKFEELVDAAYDSIDVRRFAMREWGWKAIRGTVVDTWNITPDDLSQISSGLNEAYPHEIEQYNSEKVDEYGNKGPYFDIEVYSRGDYYNSVPLDLIGQDISKILPYRTYVRGQRITENNQLTGKSDMLKTKYQLGESKYTGYYKHLHESLDDPYKYSDTFSYETVDVEDEDTGETYKKDVFTPVQIIKFKTEEGIEYIWYARQSYQNENFWTIAFGTYQGQDDRGTHKLDINLTKNTKNPFRVFATVVAIINRFIELDEDQIIHYLQFDSEGDKRTQLYLNRLLPRIEHFAVDHIETHKTMDNISKSTVTLKRIS